MAEHKKPNIVFIMYDQMRYNAAGFAGNPEVITPNMDRFAEEGVNFENAYCVAPLCSPARGGWTTGLYPHTNMLLTNYGHRLKGLTGRFLPKDTVTISDILNDAGYNCGMVGTWHMGYDETPQHGYNAMWEPYKYPDPPEADAYKRYLKQNGHIEHYRRGKRGLLGRSNEYLAKGENFTDVATMPTEHQRTTWTVDRSIHFINEQGGKSDPFFLFMNIKDPHGPVLPPQECFDLYDPDKLTLSRTRLDSHECKPAFLKEAKTYGAGNYSPEGLREIMAHYYALITHVDQQVGRFMDALKEKGIDEETIVAIVSDHGELMGDHGLFAKDVMYEGAVRVPCLFRWPKHLKAGARIKELFAGVDLMPTLLDLAAVPCPPVQGRSMADSARTGKEPEIPNTVFAEIGTIKTKNDHKATVEQLAATIMVREGAWKYIAHRFDPCEELYNLDEDPDEMINRFNDPSISNVVTRLRQRINDRLSKDGPGPYEWALDIESTIVKL